MSMLERLMAKVSPEPMSGCWLWSGYLNACGYGVIRTDTSTALAHRMSYELLVKSIPADLEIDHLCRVRSCINPDHLEPVRHRVNVQRGASTTLHLERSHCPSGHAYSGGNLKIKTNGNGHRYRHCKACFREYYRAYRASKKALALIAADQASHPDK